jgi:hypothetical protein
MSAEALKSLKYNDYGGVVGTATRGAVHRDFVFEAGSQRKRFVRVIGREAICGFRKCK